MVLVFIIVLLADSGATIHRENASCPRPLKLPASPPQGWHSSSRLGSFPVIGNRVLSLAFSMFVSAVGPPRVWCHPLIDTLCSVAAAACHSPILSQAAPGVLLYAGHWISLIVPLL